MSDWVPVAADFERVATHESGHAVVALSLGVAIEYIERLSEDGMPEVLTARDFHAGAAVKHVIETFVKLNPRQQFLIAFGGMAAETLVFGKYDPDAAAADFDALKPNVLTAAQSAGLVELAQIPLKNNLEFFHKLRAKVTKRLSASTDTILLQGAAINANFKKSGSRTDLLDELFRLLPE